MTNTSSSPKRWRARFSLRTLWIFVTLVCVYFGAWEATKYFGVPAVSAFIELDDRNVLHLTANSPFPCYIHVHHFRIDDRPDPKSQKSLTSYDHDFIWIFGWIVHLKETREGPWHGGEIIH